MNEAGLKELKKIFSKKHICISKLMSVYADMENGGQVLSSQLSSFLNLDEESVFKYCDIFKKVLSGKFDRNLYNASFGTEEEKDGGKQQILLKAVESEMGKNDAETVLKNMMDGYTGAGRFLFLVAFGQYDIPVKGTDDIVQDESDNVYNFIIGAICPVATVKEGLVFNDVKSQFESKSCDWAVGAPEAGFLYPAYNDRSSDIHSLLYYVKKPAERHEDFAEMMFGITLGDTADKEKSNFSDLIADTLGNKCTYKNISDITDRLKSETEHDDETGQDMIPKNAVRNALEQAGADEEHMKTFSRRFDEYFGEKGLSAKNVMPGNNVKIKSDYIDLNIASENTDYLERKVIDGREYLLIPVADGIRFDSIPLSFDTGKD